MKNPRVGLRAVLLAPLLLITGCSVFGWSVTAPPVLAPPEPFGDFAVGEFGGVDGRQNILRVRSDGVAVLISREPAAGRLPDNDLSRLRVLLTSEQFRVEVAREAARGPQDPMRCSDQITTEVRMGSLALSRSGPCGVEDLPSAPAFDEILAIVAPARQGDFAAPVGDVDPRLVSVRLQRLADPGYVMVIDAAGRGKITESGRTRYGRLTAEQQDTLQLLQPLLAGGSASTCAAKPYYLIRVGGRDVRPDCNRRYPEILALTSLLEDAFDV